MPSEELPFRPQNRKPRAFCALCEGPMYENNTPYAVLSIYGRLRICRTCAELLKSARPTTWDEELAGPEDIRKWKEAERRAK